MRSITAFLLPAVAFALKSPHIMLMVIDDVGWGDVSYHGGDFPTPNLDAMAAESVKLERYYVQPVCSPTRSSILTGRFPFHMGMQHYTTLLPSSTAHLPVDVPTLAETLREQGYSTHAIGKWHLGYASFDYTPTGRGFDSFMGYFQGAIGYYTKDVGAAAGRQTQVGYDFWNNKDVLWTSNTSYSVDFYVKSALDIVNAYDPAAEDAKPLFFYYSPENIHEPLEKPPPGSGADQACAGVTATADRNTLCQMMWRLDSDIGHMIAALKSKGIWDDTLLWLTTDNGGMVAYAEGGVASASSNYPLRAGKTTLYEGGVRGVSFVGGGANVFPEAARGQISHDLLHAVDIVPTVLGRVAAASTASNAAALQDTAHDLDGFDVWSTITQGKPGPRTELPININADCLGCQGAGGKGANYSAIIQGDWKLISGNASPLYDGWWSNGNYTHEPADPVDSALQIHLFNLTADPTERDNVAQDYPEVVASLQARISYYAGKENGYTAPQGQIPHPRAFPALHNNTWAPFL